MDTETFCERLRNLLGDRQATERHGLAVVNADPLGINEGNPIAERQFVMLQLADDGAVYDFEVKRTRQVQPEVGPDWEFDERVAKLERHIQDARDELAQLKAEVY